jgi:GWxTD domain-containing protein
MGKKSSRLFRSLFVMAVGIGTTVLACGASSLDCLQTQSTVDQPPNQDEHTLSPLSGPYLTWLNEDVRWIVTPEERSAYTALQNNPARLKFIEDFWQRRNSGPADSENRFKEEHYRRIAYANVHFAATHPGWITDRGRIYIVYGKPDSIDAYPSGRSSDTTATETWHYRKFPGGEQSGIGVEVKFVDSCRCGDYKLDSPPSL